MAQSFSVSLMLVRFIHDVASVCISFLSLLISSPLHRSVTSCVLISGFPFLAFVNNTFWIFTKSMNGHVVFFSLWWLLGK